MPRTRSESRTGNHEEEPDNTIVGGQPSTLFAPLPQTGSAFSGFQGFRNPSAGPSGQDQTSGETGDRNTIDLSDVYSLLQDINRKIDHLTTQQNIDRRTLEELRSITMGIPRSSTSTLPQVQRVTTAEPNRREQSVFPEFGKGKQTKREEPEISVFSPPQNSREPEGIKMKVPDAFDGKIKGRVAKQWMMRMATFVAMNKRKFPEERQVMMWILSNMEGVAADWAQPYMEKIISGDLDGPTQDLHHLEGAFYSAFGDPDAKRAAQRKLHELKQTGTIHDYTTEFRTLAAELSLNDEALRLQYELGLHWKVKEVLSNRENPPDSIEELILACTKIDNIRRENEASRPNKNQHFQKTPKVNTSTVTTVTKAAVALEDSPNFVSREEKDRRKANRLCLKCGRSGHGIKDCRTGWRKEGPKEEKKHKESGNAGKVEEEESESENE